MSYDLEDLSHVARVLGLYSIAINLNLTPKSLDTDL